jgi:hypothetical protein
MLGGRVEWDASPEASARSSARVIWTEATQTAKLQTNPVAQEGKYESIVIPVMIQKTESSLGRQLGRR